ncbi:MAG: ABC transporter ATP-binding protein [Patescibacteria group bacterium]
MVKATNLTRIYKIGPRSLTALNNVTLEIQEGEFVAITGMSGSGKSTLLHQLGLLDHPTEGKVFIAGIEVTHLQKSERTLYRLKNLGYIFQDYALLPTLTASENVLLPLLMQGSGMKDAKEKAEEALSMLGLKERINNLPSQMSGGEQQRVSIARAIVNNPKILFADEPTANLDSQTSKVVLDALQQLNNEGLTLVMVTHEPEYAKIADRNIVLADGKLVSDETRNEAK